MKADIKKVRKVIENLIRGVERINLHEDNSIFVIDKRNKAIKKLTFKLNENNLDRLFKEYSSEIEKAEGNIPTHISEKYDILSKISYHHIVLNKYINKLKNYKIVRKMSDGSYVDAENFLKESLSTLRERFEYEYKAEKRGIGIKLLIKEEYMNVHNFKEGVIKIYEESSFENITNYKSSMKGAKNE